MQRQLKSGSGVTQVLDVGSGRPTILVHGSCGNAEAGWGAILPQLAQQRRCLAPNLLGSGQTTDAGGDIQLQDLVEQVRLTASLIDEGEFDLIGYSLGGVVAAAAAAAMPQRVGRLLLLGPWAKSDWRMQVQFGLWKDLATEDPLQLARLLVLSGFSERFVCETAPVTLSQIMENLAANLAPGSARQAAFDASVDIAELLPRIKARTHVIGLTQDRIVPPAYCRTLARAIEGANYREIDSGHLVMLEAPQALLELILQQLPA